MKINHHNNWRNELDAFLIYKVLAKIEHTNSKGILFEKLSQESRHQASIWKELAKESESWYYRPSLKIKLLAILLDRRVGPVENKRSLALPFRWWPRATSSRPREYSCKN